MKVWHAHSTSSLAKEKAPNKRQKQEARTRGKSKKHAQTAQVRLSNKSYKYEPRARGTRKMPSRGTNQSENSGIPDTWDTRRMRRKRDVQHDAQENAMQKHTNRENEPKIFAKSSKIALEMELDRVLGALLIQTSITNASQVFFFSQILGAQRALFGIPRETPGLSLSLPKIASLSR